MGHPLELDAYKTRIGGEGMVYDSGNLRAISVAYSDQIRSPKVKLSRKARKAARNKVDGEGSGPKPFGMSATRTRIRPSDPAQNNPNDIGMKIIPQGQGPM